MTEHRMQHCGISQTIKRTYKLKFQNCIDLSLDTFPWNFQYLGIFVVVVVVVFWISCFFPLILLIKLLILLILLLLLLLLMIMMIMKKIKKNVESGPCYCVEFWTWLQEHTETITVANFHASLNLKIEKKISLNHSFQKLLFLILLPKASEYH